MKKRIIIFIILLLTIGGIGFSVYHIHQKEVYESMKIELKEIDTVEYGSDVRAMDLVDHAIGEIIRYPTLSTMETGKQRLVYVLEKEHIQKEIEVYIDVVDTQYPIIELKSDHITIEYGENYDPSENIEKVYDVIDGETDHYEIIHQIENTVPGDYEVKVCVQDCNQNETQKTFIVTVKKQVIAEPKYSSGIVPTYIKGILLVNKQYGLPADFGGVNEEASHALSLLQKAASESGWSLPLVSGYRSYSYQQELYSGYVARHGKEAADRFSAQAGHSEHQTGLAFDVGRIDYNLGSTPEGIWLQNHCADFGFIIRYPSGKEDITGYRYEPWHIRYVGTEHAKAIMSQGLTLEEYLGVK